jgi:hypothetical protein
VSGKKHGEGVYRYKNGGVYRGSYQEGIFTFDLFVIPSL